MPAPIECVLEDKSPTIVKSFVGVMDNGVDYIPSYDISHDAVMDWFGRSICGRASIIRFAKIHIPKCQHKVDEIARIPHVSHRLLKQIKKNEHKKSIEQHEISQESSNQQRTPDNPIRPNFEELIKAPDRKRFHCTVSSTDLEFVEIKGSLLYERMFFDGTPSQLVRKEFQKIVLGYSDEIHFIEYSNKVMPSCRANLFHRFRNFS